MASLLLDTHTLLWVLGDHPTLSTEAREEVGSLDNPVWVSLVSLWELRVKQTIGKIVLPPTFYSGITEGPFEVLTLSPRHIEAYGNMPLIHRDPFDRMLVAQAQCENLVLVTRNVEIMKYDVTILRS